MGCGAAGPCRGSDWFGRGAQRRGQPAVLCLTVAGQVVGMGGPAPRRRRRRCRALRAAEGVSWPGARRRQLGGGVRARESDARAGLEWAVRTAVGWLLRGIRSFELAAARPRSLDAVDPRSECKFEGRWASGLSLSAAGCCTIAARLRAPTGLLSPLGDSTGRARLGGGGSGRA